MTLEIGWVRKVTVEAYNLSAYRGLKRWLFTERKLVVCGCSMIYSYESSKFG